MKRKTTKNKQRKRNGNGFILIEIPNSIVLIAIDLIKKCNFNRTTYHTVKSMVGFGQRNEMKKKTKRFQQHIHARTAPVWGAHTQSSIFPWCSFCSAFIAATTNKEL